MEDPRPPTDTPQPGNCCDKYKVPDHIPREIISDEEMALIDAAFAASRSSLSSVAASTPSSSLFCSLSPTRLHRNARSIQSITLLSNRRLSTEPASAGDMEDAGGGMRSTKKRNRGIHSLLHRFRRNRALSVSDLKGAEWCEKQMEFSLLFGKPKISQAMKAGIARHAVLEEEVVKRVKITIKTLEDMWAEKILDFLTRLKQLLSDGLTRELPLVCFVEGVWMVGVIDEIRMPVTETQKIPTLVDTKTRRQAILPPEPQQRNGRLQLMCYKYMWDNLVADNFHSTQFFDFFSLNPHCNLSEDIRKIAVDSAFPAETLDDLVRYYQNACKTLPPAHDQLLLRYEFQKDNSLIGEDQFIHDADWVKGQIKFKLEFWMGEREAKYTSEEERWKCNFCKFASACPINGNSISQGS